MLFFQRVHGGSQNGEQSEVNLIEICQSGTDRHLDIQHIVERMEGVECFLDVSKEYGEKACDAVADDILSFVNTSIKWYNKENQTNYKDQSSLNRISGDSKLATISYLRHLVDDEGINAVDLSILTDTIGCYTKGSIHPYAHGFWGHDKAYCKDGGKNMSVAESWATWNYIREVGSDEEKALIKRLMPNTYGYYSGVYSEIAKWLKKNTL